MTLGPTMSSDERRLRGTGASLGGNPAPEIRFVGCAHTLTEEQVTVLTLVCEGDSDWVIARKTGLSVRTVQRRIQGLRQLLKVDSRAALAARAVELGYIKRPLGL